MSTTAQYVFQECQHHFPDLNYTYFQAKLNRALKVFVQETECTTIVITGTVESSTGDITITSPAAQTMTNASTTGLLYTFPNYIHSITDIRFKTTDGVYLDSPLMYEIDDNRIAFYSSDGTLTGEWPSEIAYLEFYGIKLPADITATTDTLDIPDMFVDALVARILMDLYATGKGALLQQSGWWRSEYQRLRLEAKRYGITQRDKTENRGVVGEMLARDSDSTLTYGSETSNVTWDGGSFA